MLCADYGRIHTPSNYVGKSKRQNSDSSVERPTTVVVRRNGKVISKRERVKK